MRNMITLCAGACVALGALTCAGSARAHHSGSMYLTTPIWISGEIVRLEAVNPHAIITLEDRSGGGQPRRWAVEGPPGQSSVDLGVVPKVGDMIQFCAFAYKPVEELSRMFPDADFSASPRLSPDNDASSPQYVAGHVMVLSSGARQMWEPHGVLAACIASSDDHRQSWIDFLNSNAGARSTWCVQKAYTQIQTTVSLQELAEEIDRSLDDPCE